MIYVTPSAATTLTAVFAEAALVDVGYTIILASDGTEIAARSTVVVEVDPGIYSATFVAPATEETYLAVFDVAGSDPTIVVDFTVTAELPFIDTVPADVLERIALRIESDVIEEELERIAAEAYFELTLRYGPTGIPITEEIEGGSRSFMLGRPADEAETITITEDSEVVAADQYRIIHRGRTVERLVGTWHRLTEITYTPEDDSQRRDEVVLKLIMLTLEYRGGVRYDRIGDVSQGYAVYTEEREALIRSVEPRPIGMV